MHMMVLVSMSFTILHILVINDVMDMIIIAAISITALMATLAVMGLNGFTCCKDFNSVGVVANDI